MGEEKTHAEGEPEKKQDADSSDTYEFMNQVIREKPKDHRKTIRKIAAIVASGVAIGGIAAGTFVFAVPAIEKASGMDAKRGKIVIPADEDPTLSVSSEEEPATESSMSADTTEASTSTDSSEAKVSKGGVDETNRDEGNDSSKDKTDAEEPEIPGQTVVTPTPAAETPTPEGGISVFEYKQLYQDMMKVADEAQKSLVEVSGISSEMDYFNQNYVNTSKISGVTVAENGSDIFILTEYRIVDNVERVQVTFYDGTMADATFQKQDPNTGLCILKVPIAYLSTETRQNLEVANLGNSYTVFKGEPVLALGSPMGYSDSVAFGTVTSVSNKVSLLDNEYNLLTTDIEGNRSGSGVLVNLGGQVVGMVCQSMGSEDDSTITALAISQIKELIQSLSNNETVPYIGISGQNVSQEISERTGIPVGVLVTEVAADSPAMLSGLKEYDVITEISGTPITTIKDYHKFLSQMKAGEVVTVTAMRKGAEGYAAVRFSVAVSEW